MKDELDFKEFDDVADLQQLGGNLLSIFLCGACIIIMLAILKEVKFEELPAATVQCYNMNVVIDSIYRSGDLYYIESKGKHENQVEEHTFKITKDEFMKYKEGQSITIHVNGKQCIIIE